MTISRKVWGGEAAAAATRLASAMLVEGDEQGFKRVVSTVARHLSSNPALAAERAAASSLSSSAGMSEGMARATVRAVRETVMRHGRASHDDVMCLVGEVWGQGAHDTMALEWRHDGVLSRVGKLLECWTSPHVGPDTTVALEEEIVSHLMASPTVAPLAEQADVDVDPLVIRLMAEALGRRCGNMSLRQRTIISTVAAHGLDTVGTAGAVGSVRQDARRLLREAARDPGTAANIRTKMEAAHRELSAPLPATLNEEIVEAALAVAALADELDSQEGR